MLTEGGADRTIWGEWNLTCHLPTGTAGIGDKGRWEYPVMG